MSTTTTDTAEEILASFEQSFGAIFDRISWAEGEIAQAAARHPEQADAIYHSFSLLSGGDAAERMSVEAVYRAHAREAAGERGPGIGDLRPVRARIRRPDSSAE